MDEETRKVVQIFRSHMAAMGQSILATDEEIVSAALHWRDAVCGEPAITVARAALAFTELVQQSRN